MQGDIEKKVFEIFRKYLFRDLTQCEDPFSESIFGEKIALNDCHNNASLLQISIKQNLRFVVNS